MATIADLVDTLSEALGVEARPLRQARRPGHDRAGAELGTVWLRGNRVLSAAPSPQQISPRTKEWQSHRRRVWPQT